MSHARWIVGFILCTSSLASADPPGLDLSSPSVDADAAHRARTQKLTGLALMAIGGLATAFGTASVIGANVANLERTNDPPPVSDALSLGLGVGTLSLGALTMGIGASTWALTDGDAMLGRRSPALSGRALRVAGAALMTVGAVLTTVSWAWAAASTGCRDDDCFDVATSLAYSALPAGIAAIALGAPLYVIGAKRRKLSLRIDSIGPLAFDGGGGVGVGGRF